MGEYWTRPDVTENDSSLSLRSQIINKRFDSFLKKLTKVCDYWNRFHGFLFLKHFTFTGTSRDLSYNKIEQFVNTAEIQF